MVFGGALTAAVYFDGDSDDEQAIRRLAVDIYQHSDWKWASPREPLISHGWTAEKGVLPYDWGGYSEALFLHLLALGSPTHPVDESAYEAWTSTYKWKSIYDFEVLYGGPLFMQPASPTSMSASDSRGLAQRNPWLVPHFWILVIIALSSEGYPKYSPGVADDRWWLVRDGGCLGDLHALPQPRVVGRCATVNDTLNLRASPEARRK